MHYEKPVLLDALRKLGLSETVRMENLTMEQLVALSNCLSEKDSSGEEKV